MLFLRALSIRAYFHRTAFYRMRQAATRLRHDFRLIDFRSALKQVLKRYAIFCEVQGCMMQKSALKMLRYISEVHGNRKRVVG